MSRSDHPHPIPTSTEFAALVLELLRTGNGRATNQQLSAAVVERHQLSHEDVARVHDPQRGPRSELEYRLAWARTALRRHGLIENLGRREWGLTEAGRNSDRGEG